MAGAGTSWCVRIKHWSRNDRRCANSRWEGSPADPALAVPRGRHCVSPILPSGRGRSMIAPQRRRCRVIGPTGVCNPPCAVGALAAPRLGAAEAVTRAHRGCPRVHDDQLLADRPVFWGASALTVLGIGAIGATTVSSRRSPCCPVSAGVQKCRLGRAFAFQPSVGSALVSPRAGGSVSKMFARPAAKPGTFASERARSTTGNKSLAPPSRPRLYQSSDTGVPPRGWCRLAVPPLGDIPREPKVGRP